MQNPADGFSHFQNEELSRIVVLGEVSMLQIALRRQYHVLNSIYYYGQRNAISKSNSFPNRLPASEETAELEEDEDDFLYDISAGSHGASHSTSPISPIYFSLKQLKDRLTKNLNVINNPSYLKPFCEVIKNRDVSGPITGLALQSILKFLNYGLIDYCEDLGAAQSIGESVTKARFIGTDTSSDEVVLLRILNVLKELIVRGFKKLNNDTVCEIMQSCFKIAFEQRLSELLRKNAEQALVDMCRTLFASIDTVEDEINFDESCSMKITTRARFGGKKLKTTVSLEEAPASQTQNSSDSSESATQKTEDVPAVPLKPAVPSNYSLLCIHELLSYLASLIAPHEGQNTDVMTSVGLNLLIVAFETSVKFIGEKRHLLTIVKDELCWNILQVLQQDKPLNLFSLSLRLAFLVFSSLRVHLKYQMEALLIRLMDIAATGNAPFEYREIALDYLYAFFQHIPHFCHELFTNYDCDPHASNLLDDMLQLFSKMCYSNTVVGTTTSVATPPAVFSPIQKTSMNALLACVKSLQKAELLNTGILTPFIQLASETDSQASETNTEKSCDITPSTPEHVDVGVICKNSLEPIENCGDTPFIEEKSEQANTPSRSTRKVVKKYVKVQSFPNTLDGIHKLKQRKRLLWTAAEQFNAKPVKGVHFLQENKLVENQKEIVNFLRDNFKLDKKQIGDYLANKKNLSVLTAFVESFNFTNLRIDEALRMYLESFRLPGEAPLISLVLEQFAHHWHESNSCPFANEDAAFGLAYAIIMLNVDQHNTNVRRQTTPMTLEEFIANLRQMNDGKDFDPKMLKEIYFAIKSNEIVMPAEQHGIVREKYLWKCLLRRSETDCGIYWFANQMRVADVHTAPEQVQTHNFIRLALLNGPIFDVLWGPVIASMTSLFDKIDVTQNSNFTRKILNQGFTSCASLCSIYGHLDNLIVSLCKFTNNSPSGQLSSVACNKNELASQCLFTIVREYGNEIRESWANIIDLIMSWFKVRMLDGIFEIEDFALEKKKIPIKRKVNQKPNKNQNEGSSNFLSSFYSYFAGNQEQSLGEYSEADYQANKTPSRASDSCTDITSQTSNTINDSCQPLSVIDESKFLHIDSLLELIKSLINYSTDSRDEDDVEVFKLEMLIQIILLNRDRVSVFWPQVSNYLLKLLRRCELSELLTERLISAIFRLAIRFSSRPDSLSDQIFLLLHQLLATFELKSIQTYNTALALHSFVTHCHSYVSRMEDWSIIFEMALYVGVGYQPKTFLRRKEASAETISVQSDAEESQEAKIANARGYTSDSEISSHNQKPADDPRNNPYRLMTGSHLGTSKGSCFKILDLPAYEKCSEVLTLIVKEILPKNIQHVDGATLDDQTVSITNMAVDTLRKFVEASVKIQNNHVRRHGHDHRTRNSRFSTRTRAAHDMASSSDSDEERPPEITQQQPNLSSYTEACSLKLLDLMHFLHLNASFHTSAGANDYLWNTVWCPLLQGIALLCCDARRPVRTCALTYLQRALLNHDLRLLTAHQWESCFNKVLFPLLAKLLEPLNICDPIGMDETRMRATNLLCKVFLQHLTPLLTLPTFTALWLTILDFMDKYMKAEMHTDLVKEAIPESLKNMLLVMDTAQCLNDSLAVITWDRIALFLPHLKNEVFPQTKAVPAPESTTVAETVSSTEGEPSVSLQIESELQEELAKDEATVSGQEKESRDGSQRVSYPWPLPSTSKYNL